MGRAGQNRILPPLAQHKWIQMRQKYVSCEICFNCGANQRTLDGFLTLEFDFSVFGHLSEIPGKPKNRCRGTGNRRKLSHELGQTLNHSPNSNYLKI